MATMIQLLLAVFAFASSILAIPTISAKGSKFFTSEGSQFYIKGESISFQISVLFEDADVSSRDCISTDRR